MGMACRCPPPITQKAEHVNPRDQHLNASQRLTSRENSTDRRRKKKGPGAKQRHCSDGQQRVCFARGLRDARTVISAGKAHFSSTAGGSWMPTLHRSSELAVEVDGGLPSRLVDIPMLDDPAVLETKGIDMLAAPVAARMTDVADKDDEVAVC